MAEVVAASQQGPMHPPMEDTENVNANTRNQDALLENDPSTNHNEEQDNNNDDDSNASSSEPQQNRNGPLPVAPPPIPPVVPMTESSNRRGHLATKYVLFSLFVACLAIVSPSSRSKLHEQQQLQQQTQQVPHAQPGDKSVLKPTKEATPQVEQIAHVVEVAYLSQNGNVVVSESSSSSSSSSAAGGTSLFFQNKERRHHPRPFKDLGKVKKSPDHNNTPSKASSPNNTNNESSKKNAFSPSRWLFAQQPLLESEKDQQAAADTTSNHHQNKKKNRRGKREKQETLETEPQEEEVKSFASRVLARFIDPALLEWITVIKFHFKEANRSSTTSASLSSSGNISETLTQIADKILRSTPRLLSLANLLLAVTYLLHSAVVALFLGEQGGTNQGPLGAERNTPPDPSAPMFEIGGVGASTSSRLHRSGRERLGGYLLFKLLLISAVMDPDTLDLLILLSWYTLLSFLRSLAYLAGVTTSHALASGQAPRRGVLKLLLAVLVCDLTAAGVCAALFHGAGWGMVLLLTCDCALLALDILNHVARYCQQVMDEAHQSKIAEMEATQIELHETWRSNNSAREESSSNERESISDVSEEDLDRASRQMDHEMELLEAIHTRRLALMDYTAFLFELLGHILTTIHFVHIWSLHGVNFTLVDGVLALHLHSAIAATGKKIIERRNHNRVVRDLDSFFEDATDLELSKAGATGDVCCICLGTMSIGNVKKVGCGHLFHANCLREVVERARSVEASRCPLCRASLIDGKQVCSHTQQNNGSPFPFFFGTTNNDRVQNLADDVVVGDGEVNRFQAMPTTNQDERALFRFSTEGILPSWLPVPAFSFEIVRRTSGGDDGNRTQQQVQEQRRTIDDGTTRTQQREQQQDPSPGNNQDNAMLPEREQGSQSFWRRFLILVGAISMSPEEEANAISQLVDMFPQYNREDLLRALRQQGSSERVAESILNGSFLGVIREGSIPDVAEPARVPQQEGTWDPTDLY